MTQKNQKIVNRKSSLRENRNTGKITHVREHKTTVHTNQKQTNKQNTLDKKEKAKKDLSLIADHTEPDSLEKDDTNLDSPSRQHTSTGKDVAKNFFENLGKFNVPKTTTKTPLVKHPHPAWDNLIPKTWNNFFSEVGAEQWSKDKTNPNLFNIKVDGKNFTVTLENPKDFTEYDENIFTYIYKGKTFKVESNEPDSPDDTKAQNLSFWKVKDFLHKEK